MTKKVYKQMLFFVITKNSNWAISAKNLVTFKIRDGVKHERMKNFNCFWDLLTKKGVLRWFADLRGCCFSERLIS